MSSLELSQGLLTTYIAEIINYNSSFSVTSIAQCGLLPSGSSLPAYAHGYITIMKGTMPVSPTLVTIPITDVLIDYSVESGSFIVQSNVNPVVISTGYLAATGTGTATWFIWNVRNDAGTIYQQAIGTVGVSGSGSDLEISDNTITTGQMYRILNLRVLFQGYWPV
jgi:hypothetical protein